MIASSENRHSLSSLIPESYRIVGHYHPSCRIKHKRRMSIGHCFSGIELQFVVSAENILPVVTELLPAKHVFPLLPAVFYLYNTTFLQVQKIVLRFWAFNFLLCFALIIPKSIEDGSKGTLQIVYSQHGSGASQARGWTIY